MKKSFENILLMACCIFFVFGAFFSWCLLTISYQNSCFLIFSAIINFFIMAILFITIKKNKECSVVYEQLKIVVGITLCVSTVIFFFGFNRAERKEDYFIAIMCFFWALWSCVVLRMMQSKEKGKGLFGLNSCRISHSFGIVIILIITILLAYEESGYQFKWDGLLYYKSCIDATLYSISSLALYGHISQTYAGIVAMFQLIVGDVGWAMIVVNNLFLVIAILGYYFLLKMTIPYKKEIFYLAATGILAFSPYFLGMVNYFSLDYCLMCLFPMLLYFTFGEKWLYQLIAGVLFCFTKETAIIIYAGLCLGIILVDCLSEKKKTFLDIFKTRHYYTMSIPCVLWLVTFLLLGPWNAGDSAVTIDFGYIIEKLKILYVFQFNWIFSLIIVLCLIIFVVRRDKMTTNKYIFALVISQLFLTLFSCIFKTVNHPRYIDSGVIFLYYVSTLCLTKMIEERHQTIISLFASIILLVSSYKTYDIVTNVLFKQLDIGEEKIITTYKLPFGDGAIYNKQMLWLEGAMNRAIDDALEDDNIIVIPAIGNYTYTFDGASEAAHIEGDYFVQRQYWNESKNRREVIKSEKNREYDIHHISNKAYINEIPNPENKNISYIFIDSIDTDIVESFEGVIENSQIIGEKEYYYRGWVLKRIVIQL